MDETNASIGVARHALGLNDQAVGAMLQRIQNDLFDLGADLCVPDRGEPLPLRAFAHDRGAGRLGWKQRSTGMNAELKPLASFVLPGGTPAAAALHVSRTICRRAERHMVELAARPDEPVSAAALKYMNRLSDLLFVASRYVNGKGSCDILWQPGQNR